MPNISSFHPWIVFVHIIGVFVFLLAHGVSVGVMLRLRRERDPAAIRALLDLSSGTMVVMSVGFLIWFIAGVLAGFSGNYWTGRAGWWLWASLAIAIVVVGLMTPLGRFYLDRVRAAVGIDPKAKGQPAPATVDAAALEAAIMSGRPFLLTAVGVGSVVVLAWLMMFKPF